MLRERGEKRPGEGPGKGELGRATALCQVKGLEAVHPLKESGSGAWPGKNQGVGAEGQGKSLQKRRERVPPAKKDGRGEKGSPEKGGLIRGGHKRFTRGGLGTRKQSSIPGKKKKKGYANTGTRFGAEGAAEKNGAKQVGGQDQKGFV